MSVTTPSISVVICAYTENRWKDILAAIHSVKTQSLQPSEIVVVIDHNRRLLQRIQKEISGVAICENAGPRGLSGGRNTGWQTTTGDIIAFLDDDAVADPDWLQHLVSPYVHDSEVIGVGGSISPHWRDGQPAAFPEEFLWVVGCSYRGLPTVQAPIRNMIGANMSLRRSALDKTTGFDSDLGRIGTRPVGCEETELCLRMSAATGGRFVYEPKAHVRHTVPASRTTFKYFRSRCYAEGISKAHVSRLAGATAALSTEISYVGKTLPSGVFRGLKDAAIQRRTSPVRKVGGILAGLTFTAAGYGVGRLRRSTPSAEAPSQQIFASI